MIGSGIGGLTAALTAASAGLGVLVLEAGKQFGGYTNPFKRGKYSFDPGLHYIGECGPGQQLTRILEKLGLADEIAFRELSPDGFDRLVFPGYEVAMPRGADRYHERGYRQRLPSDVRRAVSSGRFLLPLVALAQGSRRPGKGPSRASHAGAHHPRSLCAVREMGRDEVDEAR